MGHVRIRQGTAITVIVVVRECVGDAAVQDVVDAAQAPHRGARPRSSPGRAGRVVAGPSVVDCEQAAEAGQVGGGRPRDRHASRHRVEPAGVRRC